MDTLYKGLLKMRDGGADHRAMVEYAKRHAKAGWEASQDETMILVHFHGGGVLISPFHQVTRCYYGQ